MSVFKRKKDKKYFRKTTKWEKAIKIELHLEKHTQAFKIHQTNYSFFLFIFRFTDDFFKKRTATISPLPLNDVKIIMKFNK